MQGSSLFQIIVALQHIDLEHSYNNFQWQTNDWFQSTCILVS